MEASQGTRISRSRLGIPGAIDLVLGMKVFGQVVLSGWPFGCRGSPMARKTHFGWVLSGTINTEKSKFQRLVA